jgi:2-methylcitrate dehydratase PrpD
VASGLARGRLGLAELAPEALVEPRIERLMDKVQYEVDPGAEFPRYYGGEVCVTLEDGRTLTERVPINRGNPERPLSNAEIEAKFLENCSLTLEAGAARRIRDLILGLEELNDVAQLEDALSMPENP